MITQTTDMDIVSSILSDPSIWYSISPDGVEPFDVPYDSQCTYFLLDDSAGVVIFHPFRGGAKVHPNILPQYRGKLAFKAVEQCIQAMFGNGYQGIYAEIDPKLRHVTMFARQLGFRLLESGSRDLYVRWRLDS